ncbi:MAG: VRR-NUC domain-containing protein [Candidatus Sulfotelmatobacter sp.]
MLESEMTVDEKYRTQGWTPLKNGWPDRAYVRLKDGKLEVKLVEIKSPNDTLSTDQELMHDVLRSQGLSVQIEPASKTPKAPLHTLVDLLKMTQMLERNRQTQRS